jgi:hypothetical protein
MDERVEPGVYRHYKGGFFTVLFDAVESTNARTGTRVVVYVSHTTGSVLVRTAAEFCELVRAADGDLVRRFTVCG